MPRGGYKTLTKSKWRLAGVLPALAAWIGVASLVAFLLAALDKSRARHGGSRIPEATLLGTALVGGSPGLLLGMLLFRHKTRKVSFLLRFALVILLQGAAAWWILG